MVLDPAAPGRHLLPVVPGDPRRHDPHQQRRRQVDASPPHAPRHAGRPSRAALLLRRGGGGGALSSRRRERGRGRQVQLWGPVLVAAAGVLRRRRRRAPRLAPGRCFFEPLRHGVGGRRRRRRRPRRWEQAERSRDSGSGRAGRGSERAPVPPVGHRNDGLDHRRPRLPRRLRLLVLSRRGLVLHLLESGLELADLGEDVRRPRAAAFRDPDSAARLLRHQVLERRQIRPLHNRDAVNRAGVDGVDDPVFLVGPLGDDAGAAVGGLDGEGAAGVERALEAAHAGDLVDEHRPGLALPAAPRRVERPPRVSLELGPRRVLPVVGPPRRRVRQQRVHLVENHRHVVRRRGSAVAGGGGGRGGDHVRVAPLLQRAVGRLDLRVRRGGLHAQELVQVVLRRPRRPGPRAPAAAGARRR